MHTVACYLEGMQKKKKRGKKTRLIVLQHNLAAAHLRHKLQEAAVCELAVLVGRKRSRQRARLRKRIAGRLRAPARARLRLARRTGQRGNLT